MMTQRRFWILLPTLLLFIFLAVWLKFLFTSLVTDPQGYRYTVREGASIQKVVDDLYAENIIKQPRFFKLLVRMKGVGHALKAGEYLFVKGTKPTRLLEQIVTGSGMVYHVFTIVPGWNFRELRTEMLRDDHFHHTIQTLSDADIMQKMGQPQLKPEGQFFPDSYYFAEGSDDIIVLKRAFKAMQEKLAKAWQRRAAGLPFKSAYEALIAASIIEKEAKVPEELSRMAGVMMNRLKKDMLLQFDPTVIYGIGEHFDGTIRRSDLLSNNLFNTYVHKGLPPTPICMPGLASIDAVMHPMKHHFYYFVSRGDGTHQFSEQLIEHNKAVEIARKMIPPFFNYSLVRYYLSKLL